MTTDYPAYDDVDLPGPFLAPMFCEDCGRAASDTEDRDAWQQFMADDGPELQCPHCAGLAEAECVEQAERQGA